MLGERSDRSDRTRDRLATLRERIDAGMDRREFLRTVVTGGYALGMAHYLGVDDFLAASDDEVPVVTALVRSDPDDPFSLEERVRYVPADWYAAVENAFELNELLARVAFTGYLGSAVVPGDYDSGTASISIGVSSAESSIPDAIREFADDVSIDAESFIEIEDVEVRPDSAEPRILEDPVGGAPSGVACETPSSMATLGPALYDPSTERSFFTTAEHAFEGDGDPVGDQLTVPIQGAEQLDLGRVSRAHPIADVAAIEPNGSVAPTSWIDAPTPARVRGQLTRYGLADLLARDERLEKVGALTGHTTGRVQGVDAVTCFTEDFCRRGQIRWGGEMDLTDGDSGSVSYYRDPEGDDGDVLVAGFNNARTWWPGQSYVWGISAYRLTEKHGYHF
ncbi:hypothetical protein [Halobiforma nitratireducens]|uniref:Uncharacterized protein n=1 Tax=Halobiforma nitratireducens JCM 10879 TaxID=1227454 RepID=M0M6R4_9EURY|nr:hypothetical protein [Halobiforma nitratireducens]EMA40055.1 hypothetical protein C446_07789 [Halobiforma nitratireducens JCM 10879]